VKCKKFSETNLEGRFEGFTGAHLVGKGKMSKKDAFMSDVDNPAVQNGFIF